MDPESHAAANDALVEAARKWLGRPDLPRDRDVAADARAVVRITAFLRAADGRWDRGEVIVRPHAEYAVWQPFPQGAATVLAAPFSVLDRGALTDPGAARVHEIELVTADARLELRVAADDLALAIEFLGAPGT